MSTENEIENQVSDGTESTVVMKPRVEVSLVVDYLNELLEADRDAITALVLHRVATNEAMITHPTVCVMCDSDKNGDPINPVLGLLGVINGIVGPGNGGWHYIAAEFDEDGHLHRFLQTPQASEE